MKDRLLRAIPLNPTQPPLHPLWLPSGEHARLFRNRQLSNCGLPLAVPTG